MQKTMTTIAEYFFHACFFALMACVALIKFVYLYELLPSFIASIGAIFLAIIFVLMIKFWDKIQALIVRILQRISEYVQPAYMMLIFAFFSLLIKAVVIVTLDINSLIHPDINVYVTTAYELAETGIAKSYAGYCRTFPHMFWFSIFLLPIIEGCGISHVALAVYLAVISTVSMLLVFDTIRHALSYEQAILYGIINIILPSQALLPGYITHEQALTFFLSISLWLYFRVMPGMNSQMGRISAFALTIVCLMLAIQVNSVGIVAAVALCITLFLHNQENYGKRSFLKNVLNCLILIVVLVVGGRAFEALQMEHSQLKEGYMDNDRVTWTLYVGSKTEAGWFEEAGKKYNSYSEESTELEIQEYRHALLRESYKELFSHPQSVFSLLKNKLLTIWSCFTYPIGYSNETISNPKLREFYNHFLFKPLTCLEYGISVLLVFVGLISRAKNRKMESGKLVLFFELYMLGVTAMLLLTECNNKYTISLQPIYIAACLAMLACKINQKNACSTPASAERSA